MMDTVCCPFIHGVERMPNFVLHLVFGTTRFNNMIQSLFPKHLTGSLGAVTPIYLIPIAGSQELLCIAGVSHINGTYEVRRAFSRTEMRILNKLNTLIDTTVTQITEHLTAGHELHDFSPIVQGVSFGEPINGDFGSHEIALRTLFRNCSMFYTGQ